MQGGIGGVTILVIVTPNQCQGQLHQQVRYGWTVTSVLPGLQQVQRIQQLSVTCTNGVEVLMGISYALVQLDLAPVQHRIQAMAISL